MSALNELRALVRAIVVEATNMDVANERDLQQRIDMLKAWVNDPATPRSQREQHEAQLAKLRQQLRAARKGTKR